MIHLQNVEVCAPPVLGTEQPRPLLTVSELTIAANLTAVIGANGSGKSTLLQLFNGLVTPQTGSVRVGEIEVTTHPKLARRKVGFVFTDPSSQLVMPTVQEDIELSLRHLPRSQRQATALKQLARLGIQDLATRSVYELSGGQKQLVAIAAVLAIEPQVLVLDEPTTLLDLQNRELIKRTLQQLAADGLQVVFSTHDLELAAAADEVILTRENAVAGTGDPQSMIAAYRASATGIDS